MYTVEDTIKTEYIIKKSRFICYFMHVRTKEEIVAVLSNIKNDYKDASHIVYAYRLMGTEKCTDDGEPSGTAGFPLLNLLKQNDLVFTISIVIRYFGGIKLGAGGLIRAYGTAAKEALQKCCLFSLVAGYRVWISFTYEETKQADYLLKNYKVLDKFYDEQPCYLIEILKNEFQLLENTLLPAEIKIVKKESCYIKKNIS